METITRLCPAAGCDRPVQTKGLCQKHYKRWRRRGTTHDITGEERFFANVTQADSGCWIWIAGKTEFGYGQFNDQKQKWLAHRWAYNFLICKIPAGLALDHLCRTPWCVNPWHLDPVTDRVNVVVRGTGITAQSARKTHCLRGHPFDAANTYIPPKRTNRRYCRACARIRDKR